ncbi:hypothetical protein P7K49_029043 [Saguinus oedipus]|uniref:Uncharacterized protein n=1 Tax=Saguinus oedipus TaxID=9490 RepID=A0ABQ9U6Z1_SAGOE|nr:hypothetical protein P7K49_029043 [Saguinus oedipus]
MTPFSLEGQNQAIKGPFSELCPGHDLGTISYNECYVAKSLCIVLDIYPDKVSVDIMNVTATLELQAVKNIANDPSGSGEDELEPRGSSEEGKPTVQHVKGKGSSCDEHVPHDPMPQDHHLHGLQEVQPGVQAEAHHQGHPQAAEQRLYKDNQVLDNSKTLDECGFTKQHSHRPQSQWGWTSGQMTPLRPMHQAILQPPELPNVVKPQDLGCSANEQAVP